MKHTNKSCNEALYHHYSPLHIITTILHTLPLLSPVFTSPHHHHHSPHTSPIITIIHLPTSSPPFSTHFAYYHLYSPPHIITTILHTLPPSTDQFLKPVITELHICFLIQVLTVLPSFLDKKKMWTLHGTKCGLCSRCGEMARSDCSIACMAV